MSPGVSLASPRDSLASPGDSLQSPVSLVSLASIALIPISDSASTSVSTSVTLLFLNTLLHSSGVDSA